jgi:hypothetical protein
MGETVSVWATSEIEGSFTRNASQLKFRSDIRVQYFDRWSDFCHVQRLSVFGSEPPMTRVRLLLFIRPSRII